jgi:hypothetical protein
MADDVQIGVSTTGVDEAVNALGRVSQAEGAVASAGQQATAAATAQARAAHAQAQATRAQAVSAQQAAQRIGMIANSLQQVGSIVVRTNPELASLGHNLSQVGQFAAAGGAAFGPYGAAAGGLIGIIGSLATHLEELEQAHRDALAAQQERIQATRAERNAIEPLVELIEREETARRIQAGRGTVAETRTALAAATRELTANERQLGEARTRLTAADRTFTSVARAHEIATRGGAEATNSMNEMLVNAQRRFHDARDDVNRFSMATVGLTGNVNQLTAALSQAEQAEKDRQANENRNRQAAAQAREREQRAQEAARRAREERRDLNEWLSEQAAEQAAGTRAVLDTWNEVDRVAQHRATEAFRQIEAFFAERDRMIAEEQRGVRNEGAVMGADLDVFRQLGTGTGMAQTEAFRDALHAREDAMRAHQAALRDMEAQGTEWTAEEFNRRVALHQESLSMQREGMRENAQIMQGMWSSLGSTVTDAAGQMFKFVISGAEGGTEAFLALLDSFLESTAIQYAIKALAEGAEAVAAAARYDYAAAGQHAAAAALAAGVAIATGVAGAAIQTPSAAGAAGGGGRPPPVQPTTGSAAAQGGNFTVNIYSPNAVTTEREQAEMIAAIMRVGRRAGGGGMRS